MRADQNCKSWATSINLVTPTSGELENQNPLRNPLAGYKDPQYRSLPGMNWNL